jgi:hypothetical protein
VTDGRKWKSLSKKRYACAIGSDREKREDRGMRIVICVCLIDDDVVEAGTCCTWIFHFMFFIFFPTPSTSQHPLSFISVVFFCRHSNDKTLNFGY